MPAGKLFIVGTPIGNLDDITLRAIHTLSQVDFLVVEDSRVTLKLLNHLGIKKKLVSYFRYSKDSKIDLILQKLLNGETVAMVSDAGMPCISDPGEKLITACISSHIEVVPIPGVNAAITALVASGIDCSIFCFEGFLSTNKRNRLKKLKLLENEPRTIIFYEAPHKLKQTLNDLLKAFGNRKVCVARELTKLHEQFLRGSLEEIIEYFDTVAPKGELVLVVQGAWLVAPAIDEDILFKQIEVDAQKLFQSGMKLAEVSKTLASERISRNKIYNMLLNKQNWRLC
ncbi:MAG: 16S rRNA (cytidine(1402)-2'-O)-methyltransferase [Oscillospiraceae bacterium]|nr:16S rRNA (cytidine(1402)-2'-O)-methyltransferase [Oscillospiraceae bacterium]